MNDIAISSSPAPVKKPRFRVRLAHLMAGTLALVAGVGCQGPRAMRGVFIDYASAYADTSNEQLLLNLARSANSHPVYFMQMGPINSSFQFGAQGGSSVGQTRTRGPGPTGGLGLQDMVNLGGNLSLNAGEQPSFSFTPLSGASFAAAIFNPIDPKIFFNLYAQGWPADQLFRVMVESVTLAEKDGTRTFVNVIDSERTANYRNFLTLAGIAREFQKHRLLNTNPERNGFVLSDKSYSFLADLQKDATYRYESDGTDFTPFVNNEEAKKKAATITFELRTFEGVLQALARESRVYDYIVAKDGDKFITEIPADERQPVLRIKAPKTGKLTEPLVSISYRGTRYTIVDEYVDKPDTQWEEVRTWNRDVFNLLNKLYVQISLDPSKLPVQQLIQIH